MSVISRALYLLVSSVQHYNNIMCVVLVVCNKIMRKEISRY